MVCVGRLACWLVECGGGVCVSVFLFVFSCLFFCFLLRGLCPPPFFFCCVDGVSLFLVCGVWLWCVEREGGGV